LLRPASSVDFNSDIDIYGCGLKCLYTNLDTFHNKKNELMSRISDSDPDIIGLTEIKPKTASWELSDIDLMITGYTLYTDLAGRGAALYVKDSLLSKVLKSAVPFESSVWCSIPLINNDTLLVGVIYRSPSLNDEQCLQLNSVLQQMITKSYSHVMIMGDFNYPDINWESQSVSVSVNNPASVFLNCCKDLFLCQHVSQPTHFRSQQHANILDLVMTNEPSMIDCVHYTEPVGNSHHLVLGWTFTAYGCYQEETVKRYFYSKGDYVSLRETLMGVDWNNTLRDKSAEEMWDIISKHIVDATDTHVPHKTFTSQQTPRKPLWMNDRAFGKIRKKRAAFNRYKETREGKDYLEYAKARNAAKNEIRKAIRDYEKEIAMKAKANPKAFYQYVNTKTKSRTRIADINSDDGHVLTTNRDKAELFNKFFSSVFTVEDTDHMPSVSTKPMLQSLCDITFTVSDIEKLLLKLNCNKSPGPDNIHPRILKECASVLSLPLWILFSSSLHEGKLPVSWKNAKVTPIFKKGSRADTANYRPISLTSVVCKTMEKLIRDSLLQHMINNGFLSDTQHGFVRGRSCTTQLLRVIDAITELYDRGADFDMVYLDFSKAFDSVPHQRLLLKLKGYGVGGPVLEWIKSFLSCRQQQVVVGGFESSWADVLSGVPQGSVLGPVLFICYINDMPDLITSLIYMYADDAKLLNKVCVDNASLQSDLDTLCEWSMQWQLKFNIDKCKVMHFGVHNVQKQYTMPDYSGDVHFLNATVLEKDLGIWSDPSLKFSVHVTHVVNKANQILGLIRRSFTYIDSSLMKTLYVALVRPHLEYGNVVWHPFLKKDIELLESVQHRATKMVPSLKHLCYEDRLKAMDLPSLMYRRLRGDAIETYKYLHGVYQIDSSFLPLNQSNTGVITRGHCLKLLKRDCKTAIRANFLSYRIVNFWNSLPEHVVTADSVNSFKGRFDKFCSSLRFSTDVHEF